MSRDIVSSNTHRGILFAVTHVLSLPLPPALIPVPTVPPITEEFIDEQKR